ncbi:radical SAM protein [Dehalogenimonas sp. THU2]|uniref:B12-binding domain-containing radical SAM protein n=1 Tax=Dehalogenimonas sp. THU2 TaxID=3151121 RepID=UPI00321817CF
MLELADHLDGRGSGPIDSIKGLVFKKDNQIIRNEPRPFIEDLDQLPDPAWHMVDVKQYWAFALNTSRGCPFKCTFCYNTRFHNGYRADLSVSKIIAQIEHLQKEYGAKSIRFFEDNFTFNRKRLREFCNGIIQRKIKFEWDCEARADLSEEEIALMAKAGCTSVGLGVETGSHRMLHFLKKGMHLPQMEKSFWLFVKYKISPRLYILHALPTETIEDFAQTHELMERLDFPPYLYMHFVPYPGTPLAEYCFNKGLVEAPKSLAEWGEFVTKAGMEMNLSDLPDEVLAELRSHFRRTYTTRRLRFAIRHRPGFLFTGVTHPIEFFKTIRDLFKSSLAYIKGEKDKESLPFNILKSPTIIWYRKHAQAVAEQVAKRTAELQREVDLLNRQLEKNSAGSEGEQEEDTLGSKDTAAV